jgi:hypothetical protein
LEESRTTLNSVIVSVNVIVSVTMIAGVKGSLFIVQTVLGITQWKDD